MLTISGLKRHKTLVALVVLGFLLAALLLLSDPKVGFNFHYKIF